MRPLLSIQEQELSRLRSGETIEIFSELLHAEAHRLRIPTTMINVPRAENVPDGGVDAWVDAPADLSGGDLIQNGLNCYQIKSGEDFKPWQKSKLKQELFNGNEVSCENLAPSVRDCLEKNGCYALVCFGHDLTRQQEQKTKGYLTELFSQCGFNEPRCPILSQRHLIAVARKYPAIICKLLGYQGEPFYDYKLWSTRADMLREFVPNEAQKPYIDQIRKILKERNSTHIRIWGEPGIGKTRLLFEVLGNKEFTPLVVYTDKPESFLDSSVFRDMLRDESIQAIVVLDDCSSGVLARFLNLSVSAMGRIQSISVFQENDKRNDVIQIQAPSLNEDEIIAVLRQHYPVPNSDLRRWAELCSGSPRVAHVIGENLAKNPDDPLRPTSLDNLWERYIQGSRKIDHPRNEKTRQVLRHIALFKRFGFESPVGKEAAAVLALIKDKHPLIGEGDFQEIVTDLRERRILQGERTLYITPKALHIWLWADWFDTYGSGFNLDKFLDKLPSSLTEWFYEMFRYAEKSDAAKRCIKQLVGPDGPFRDRRVIRSESGSRFLLSMTEASPEACLQCLEATIGKWSIEDLKKFTEGRQNIVFALEKIVVWEDLFQRGARLLLKFAEAENEFYYSNNASGVFTDLFAPVSTTEASPEERFPILKEAAESESPERRQLGLHACSKALETGQSIRMVGPEFQGTRKKANLWHLKPGINFLPSYQRVFTYLVELISKLDGSERDFAAEIVLNRARGLFDTPSPLPDLCINTLKDFLADGILSETRVLEVLEDTLEYDGEALDVSVRTTLQTMREELIGRSLSGRLTRFVKLDRPSDHLDSDREKIFNDLACQALESPEELLSELSWLVTQEAVNGGSFGYYLGIADKKDSLLELIVTAQDAASEENASMDFLGGYTRALFERNQKKWEDILDDWASHPTQKKWVLEVTWRSGITDRAASRISSLVRQNDTPWQQLILFRFRPVIRKLSEKSVIDWFNILLALEEPDAAKIAVYLFYAYYAREDQQQPNMREDQEQPIPLEIGKKVLVNPLLTEIDERSSNMLGYAWAHSGKAFGEQYPDERSTLFDFLIKDSLAGLSRISHYDGDGYQLAHLLVKSRPVPCWHVLEKQLSIADDLNTHKLLMWIAGGGFADPNEGLWGKFPLDQLLQWASQDVEKRVPHIARLAPKTIESNGEGSITRELLIRFGEREDVRGILTSNFFSGIWSGNSSEHYRKIQEQLRNQRSQHEEPVIRSWIDETISSLDQMIERAEMEEERRDWQFPKYPQ